MDTLEVLLASSILLLTPILLAALGETLIERSGVLNIAIEGVMLSGCFIAAGALQLDLGLLVATAVAVPLGALLGLMLAWLFVLRLVNQIVGGVLVNLLLLGLTTILFVTYFDADTSGKIMGRLDVPGLSELPLLGPSLFDQPALVYVAFALVPAVYLLLERSWFGLHCRAAGERPQAVDTVGVNVAGLRVAALALGSALIALGGASLVVLQSGAFTAGMTDGQGFIALAIVMVARWNPLLALPAAALFGLAQSFQFHAQTIGLEAIAPQFWAMLPYLVTIVAVAVGRNAGYPRAIGVPFVRREPA